jgi:hypothetical protein
VFRDARFGIVRGGDRSALGAARLPRFRIAKGIWKGGPVKIARWIAAPVVALAALLRVTGCGEGDATIGDTATITSMVGSD